MGSRRVEPPAGSAAGLPGEADDRAASCVSLLACPVCLAPLGRAGRALGCAAGHSYDLARQGHVDLLPAGHGRSGITGDTAGMVEARRRFLDAGHYQPLTRAVVRTAAECLMAAAGDEGRRPVALDAGCGDGSYLGAVARLLAAGGGQGPGPARPPCLFGLDVSRPAVRLAAGRHKETLFFRGDVNHRICMVDNSVDVLLNVFAPRNAREFGRVVRRDGTLLVVVPGPGHLAQLRGRLPLLDIPADKRDRTVADLAPEFRPAGEERVEHDLELDGDALTDLLRMTPSAWHLDDEHIADAAAMAPLRVTASFLLMVFRVGLRLRVPE